jgi:signal peptidase I
MSAGDIAEMATVLDEHEELRFHLFMETLRSAGEARLAVAGASMLPSIWPGDVLEIHRVEAAALSLGDIVVFARENRLTVHRLVEVHRKPDEVVFITRGDRLPAADLPVSTHQLLGRVQTIRRGDRNIIPRMTPWTRMASVVLCRSDLLTRLLLHLALVRRNSFSPEKAWAN